MNNVFSKKELKDKSTYRKHCNEKTNIASKGALDCARVWAMIGQLVFIVLPVAVFIELLFWLLFWSRVTFLVNNAISFCIKAI